MKRGIRRWGGLLLLFACAADLMSNAQATSMVWNFRDVALDDGGSVSGHFTYATDVGPHVTEWSVWVTGGNTANFPIFEYRPDNSTLGEGSGGEIGFLVPGTQRQIIFRRSLPLTGNPLYVPLDLSAPTSSACESFGAENPRRLISAGALFSDPAPTRVRWFFEGVTLSDGATVSGYADQSPGDTMILKWAIAVKGGNENAFSPLSYVPANSTSLIYIPFDDVRHVHELTATAQPTREFRYMGQAPLGADGGRVAADTVYSEECFNCAPYRLFSGGTLRGVTDETWGDGFE